jgi:hypothetical protein
MQCLPVVKNVLEELTQNAHLASPVFPLSPVKMRVQAKALPLDPTDVVHHGKMLCLPVVKNVLEELTQYAHLASSVLPISPVKM